MRKILISAVLLALAPFAAHAENSDSNSNGNGDGSTGFNWNAAVTSEYMFRGITQTDDHPALQLGAGYNWSNGVYIGTWGSNVDFGDATDAEVDTFVGWNHSFNDDTSLDLQLVRYNYIGEPTGVDYAYNELVGKVGFAKHYSATLGYTNDYLATSTSSTYLSVGGNWPVGHDVNLTASIGHTTTNKTTIGDSGYTDYSVGANRNFGPVNVSLNYVGSDNKAENIFGKDNAEKKFVLTFSVGG